MYLDTANLDEIKEAMKTGVIAGITTNPTILKKEGKPRFEQIDSIMALNPPILFVQVIGDTTEELFEDFLKIDSYAKERNYSIGVKVPMSFMGLECVKKIKQANPEMVVLGTAIYSADQVILSALAGCDLVAPYVNRMYNNAIDAMGEINKMKTFIVDRGLDTEILAASFKNTNQVTEALMSGADTCTIPFDLFKQMIDKELAIGAIKVFNEHGRELED